jgi:hypothetical protein
LVRGNVRTDGEAPLASAQRRPALGAQPLRSAMPAARPAAVKPEPVKAPVPAPPPPPAIEPEETDSEPPPSAPSATAAKAPPPVVPALGKHAKAKKKRRDA